MAKMTVGKGLDDFISKSEQLKYKISSEVAGRCLYPGAGILADALKSQLSALPTSESKHGSRRNPTPLEKSGLIESMGIAKKRSSGGSSDITIGFDGYNSDVTKKYPGGHPNAMIANAINAGNSFMNRIPFKRAAVNQARASAEAAMIAEAEKIIKEIID